MGYETLEHTADLRLRIWGGSQEELFTEALRALTDVLRPKSTSLRVKRKRKFKIKSPDTETLLVDFLNEALRLSQSQREIYKKVSFQKISEKELEAELEGTPAGGFEKEVKAVTYHEVQIKKNVKGDLETNLVLDI
jgi:SHS2 domain-containing protein